MDRKFFLYAPQVHTGGGLVLLQGLLAAPLDSFDCHVILDSRVPREMSLVSGWTVKHIVNSYMARLHAEKWLFQNTNDQDVILCFSNLPPLFEIKGRVVVFIQNRYLIDDVSLSDQSFLGGFRINIQRFWLKRCVKNANVVVVQTPSMRALFEKNVSESTLTKIVPFVTGVVDYKRSLHKNIGAAKRNCQFIYVASGEPHKNHIMLIDAFVLLAKQSIFPRLVLTVDGNQWPQLLEYIDVNTRLYGLKISNHGNVPHSEVFLLLSQSDALIYPSLFESFGLPLVEARKMGLPILASEKDYVRDMIEPDESFDPLSSRSIARSIMRFIKSEDEFLLIRNPRDFLREIVH